jgi:hypothetical protein
LNVERLQVAVRASASTQIGVLFPGATVRRTGLIRPNARYESSLRSFVREFADAGEDLVPWVLADLGGDIAAYVEWLEQQSQGRKLQQGRVPHSTRLERIGHQVL